MGYVLRSQQASRDAVRRAGQGIAWFSTVTIGYHLFFLSMIATFLTWAFASEPGLVWASLWVPLIAFAIAYLVSFLNNAGWLTLAAIILAATIASFILLGPEHLASVGDLAELAPSGAVGAAPLFALGFLLCPHLDATLHRARQSIQGPHAFALFGIGFAFTLVFVASYAVYAPYALPPLVLAFFAYQAIFTIAAHLRELRIAKGSTTTAPMTVHRSRFYRFIPLLVPFVFWIGLMIGGETVSLERAYLRFVVMYGLVFPAIMLIWLPWRNQRAGICLILVLILGLPIAELGMFWGPKWLLVIPVFLLVGGAVLLRVISNSNNMINQQKVGS